MYFHNGGKSNCDNSTDDASQLPIEIHITFQYGRQEDFYKSKSYWYVREIWILSQHD